MIKIDVIELMKKEMLRRFYSLRTIKTYVLCVKRFLIYCDKEPRRITKKDIKEHLDKLMEKKVSGSTINVHLNALKFVLEELLCKSFAVKIKYSKTSKQMPIFLTKEETARLIYSIKNERHRLMIELMYGAGLRVSELVNLKVRDLQFDRNYGWVRHGKGNKDRLFIIALSLKDELLGYISNEDLQQDSWLFKSYNGHMSIRSVQEIVKRAAKDAGIHKSVHPHTLRHSYATHLIENGYDVASVQSLLGHNNAETTMVYVHMASPNLINVRSPLDSLPRLEKSNEKSDYEFEKTPETSPRKQGDAHIIS